MQSLHLSQTGPDGFGRWQQMLWQPAGFYRKFLAAYQKSLAACQKHGQGYVVASIFLLETLDRGASDAGRFWQADSDLWQVA